MPSHQEPDYDQIDERLSDSPLHPTAAEAHGMLSGLICAGVPSAAEVWLDELFAEADREGVPNAETRELLNIFAERTRERIEAPELEFAPLLPEDECSLPERAVALYDWARGFVYGLGIAGLKQDDLSEQGREAFGDLAEITRLDLDALDEGEENEEALAEIQEFVWVAALLLYEDRARAGAGIHVQG
jgi:yecA family protein